jgi:rubrerythrin
MTRWTRARLLELVGPVEALEGGEELVIVAHVEARAVVPHHADLFGAGGHALQGDGRPAFTRDQEEVWRCRNCGYLHTVTAVPDCCPACALLRATSSYRGRTGRVRGFTFPL